MLMWLWKKCFPVCLILESDCCLIFIFFPCPIFMSLISKWTLLPRFLMNKWLIFLLILTAIDSLFPVFLKDRFPERVKLSRMFAEDRCFKRILYSRNSLLEMTDIILALLRRRYPKRTDRAWVKVPHWWSRRQIVSRHLWQEN